MFPILVQALDDEHALLCAAAARLLQHSKGFTRQERDEAGRKIMELLADKKRSRRPLDPPGWEYKVWRLDDVLFETLRALADG